MTENSTSTSPTGGIDLSLEKASAGEAVPAAPEKDAFKSLIQGREEQRKKIFAWIMCVAGVFSLSLLGVSMYFVCKIILFVSNADNQISVALESAGSLWHILLILIAPPTAVITLMVRSISFTANERDFGKNSHDDSSNIPILNMLNELGKALIDLVKTKAG